MKKENDTKENSPEKKLLQEEIEYNIVYGYDRKKKKKRMDSTESSSENPDGIEKFDNDEELAISPTGNPNLNPSKV